MSTIDLELVAEHLKAAGFPVVGGAISVALIAYQAWHGLEVTGTVTPETARVMAQPRFCGHPDVMPMAEALQAWPNPAIRWHVKNPAAFAGLDAAKVREAFAWAWGQWASVCGIEPTETADEREAHVVIECARIDRSGQVLAWSELADGTAKRKAQRYDAAESWVWVQGTGVPSSKIDLGRVACHEIGHVLGLPHIAKGNLLQPLYDARIWTPQAGDIREVVARYGLPRKPGEGTPPAPPATPGAWTITLQGTGSITSVSIPGFRVTKVQQS